MKHRYLTVVRTGIYHFMFAVALFSGKAFAQAPAIAWDKTFGGTKADALYCVQETSDGGFILGGYSESGITGNKTQASKGSHDYWVIKTDNKGTKVWDKTIGGSGLDQLYAVYQTKDGGYILGGHSTSGKTGDKSNANKGAYLDYWIVKLDADGNKQWDNNFGTTGFVINEFHDLRQTADGGYIIGGMSDGAMSGDKSENSKGGNDFWVLKLDATGNKVWDKTIGGSGSDNFVSLVQTTDGGYLLAGYSDSPVSGDKTEASKGTFDYWIVKLSADGAKSWDKTIGSSASETLGDLALTADGGFLLGGYTPDAPISGDKTEASIGLQDFWVVKTDANGVKLWDKTIGGTNSDKLFSVAQTQSGEYILGGSSPSKISGDKTENNFGVNDYWVALLDANGRKLWTKTVGGNNTSLVTGITGTKDGGILMGGRTNSSKINDKSEDGYGILDDYWIVKLAAPTVTGFAQGENELQELELYPNPTEKTTGFSLHLVGTETANVQLFNSLGQLVASTQVLPTTNALGAISTENLQQGLYTVIISQGNRKALRKVVIK